MFPVISNDVISFCQSHDSYAVIPQTVKSGFHTRRKNVSILQSNISTLKHFI